jgi:ATP-dependent RNA helicase
MFTHWDDPMIQLKLDLLRGIYASGFDAPSPIQQQAIPLILKGQDLMAQAQSGTGKTGAFCIGVLQSISPDPITQAIILSPTRELATQTKEVFDKLASSMKIRSKLLIGGSSVDADIQEVRRSTPHALIGCPGRVCDFLKHNVIDATKIKLIVLDEADEILSQGFQPQVQTIFKSLSTAAQVLMFSATVSETLTQMIPLIMAADYNKILVDSSMLTLEGISQHLIHVNNDTDKFEVLKDLYAGLAVSQSIIYCNSVKRVHELYTAMRNEQFPVCCIHGDMDRDTRTEAYAQFKAGKFRMLISSDVTARGIDIQQVSVVINFDVPKVVETYLHRIGRSGRWGRKGLGLNLVTKYDLEKIKAIERYYSTEITEFKSLAF